ncbi:MAG TPA: hypothetical protein VJ927_00700 [Actinomycetota bacterium]|nr:hypothetical protein [Actinomycetota bacterium]
MRARSSIGLSILRTVVGLVALLALAAGSALTAANVIEETAADENRTPIEAGGLAPDECAGMTLTNTVTGSGVIAGSIENDLIVGSAQADTIEALAGDDCIQAEGDADVIEGGPGVDVCIGGAGVDTFLGCETEIQ